MRICFDIETDGFLEDMTKIHVIATLDVDNAQHRIFGPNEIEDAITYLQQADEIIGHNCQNFDICAIQKLYPNFSTEEITVTDTLVLSRLIHSDLKNEDFAAEWTKDQMPTRLYGSHSLKAWGLRLGILKGDFGETTDWSEWSPAMSEYCLQDVIVCHALWEALAPDAWPQKSIQFEHSVAEICDRIGRAGWTFDMKKASELYARLALERASLDEQLRELFPSWTVTEEFIPKVNNKARGYRKGEVFLKEKEVQFNPNSRRHIEHCLRKKYDWQPTAFSPSGDAKIDESVLVQLPYPEAQKLARSFMLQKRIGQLAEGKQAWMRLVDKDGKLRHVINSNGAVTGRATHFNFNCAQVPSVRAAYGKECRELFTAAPGYTLVGADLSGIELRCLAHFLDDGGKYAETILQGDIHTQNMHDMGLEDRSAAKVAIYCLIFGGGDRKLGEAINGSAKDGRNLRERFYKANPAFAKLLRQLRQVVEKRGHLIGLDGRKLPVRGHAHCNVLLQSAAALISKRWIQLIDQSFKSQQIDAQILAWIHDEVQVQTRGDHDVTGDIIIRCAEEAGKSFGFKIPIAAEYSVGKNWADTH